MGAWLVAATKVVVLVAGSDPGAAGLLGRTLEDAAAGVPGVELVEVHPGPAESASGGSPALCQDACVELVVQTDPAGAQVSVDGLTARSPVQVTRGRHPVEASAAGFRTVTREIAVEEDGPIRLSLPHELGEWESLVRTAAVPDAACGALCERFDAELLVAAVAGTGSSSIAIFESGTRIAQRMDADAPGTWAAAAWVASEIAARVPPPPLRGRFVVDAGPAYLARIDTLVSADGRTFRTGFSGTGARTAARWERGALGAELGVTALLGNSQVDVERDDGTKRPVRASSFVAGRASVSAGGAFVERGFVRVHVRVDAEQERSPDRSGVVPSGTAVRPGIGGEMDLALDGRVGFEAEVALHGPGIADDSPHGLGRRASVDRGVSAGAALRFEPRASWSARVAYRGERRHVRYEGASSDTWSPVLTDVERRQSFHWIDVTVRRRF